MLDAVALASSAVAIFASTPRRPDVRRITVASPREELVTLGNAVDFVARGKRSGNRDKRVTISVAGETGSRLS